MELAANMVSHRRRPNYPLEFRRQIAQAAEVPGVSVSALARQHGLNVNMVFTWRRRYREGLLTPYELSKDAPHFLPVSVVTTPNEAPSKQDLPRSQSIIEITVGDTVVRIHGPADADTVQAVLRGLQR